MWKSPLPVGVIGGLALAVFGLDFLKVIPPGFTYSLLFMLLIVAGVNFGLGWKKGDGRG